MSFEKGIILKGVAGSYTVKTEKGKIVESKPRGIFRKDEITPVAGDKVEISLLPVGEGRIETILKRKNVLARPPVANIDQLIIVNSLKNPKPNFLTTDKIITIAIFNEIEPIIVINKADLGDSSEFIKIYENAGFKVIATSAEEPSKVNDGILELKDLLKNKISAFAGNSGVGKSSILNAIYPAFNLKTAEISEKLGRGRHTTRTTELYSLKDVNDSEGFIVDTPGFSSLDITAVLPSDERELDSYFPDFSPYKDNCKFRNCAHVNEAKCAVTNAVKENKIEKTRYNSYKSFYEELSKTTDW